MDQISQDDLAGIGGQLAQHSRVVTAIDDDRGVGVIFGAGANHGGAADIDILDSIFKCAVGLGGFCGLRSKGFWVPPAWGRKI